MGRGLSSRGKVHVLGAGIAGLTAAHELVERGYEVHVYEASFQPGGKAATQYPCLKVKKEPVTLPAEHGFRLFPSFYTHVIDTMSRIPFDRRRRYHRAEPREGADAG